MTNLEIANRIYTILVNHAGASERDRELFQVRLLFGHMTEWRFCGSLGFGGKFWYDRSPWKVSCYREDETPERLDIIGNTNRELAQLWEEVHKS